MKRTLLSTLDALLCFALMTSACGRHGLTVRRDGAVADTGTPNADHDTRPDDLAPLADLAADLATDLTPTADLAPPADLATTADLTWTSGTADRPAAAELTKVDAQLDLGTVLPLGACVVNPAAPSLVFDGVAGLDFDEDGIPDSQDNCPAVRNTDQGDSDGDGLGDACDPCTGSPDGDGDGVCDIVDNCPLTWNPTQIDSDRNGVGNACDTQYCNSIEGKAELQGMLTKLLQHPEMEQLLSASRWRVMAFSAYCASTPSGGMPEAGTPESGSKPPRGLSLELFDYTHAKDITLSYLPTADTLVSLRALASATLAGPQPSAEESWEAIQMAAADPAVRARIAAAHTPYPGSPSVFFYEFGSTAVFPGCATGRCVDVLYDFTDADGGFVAFSVVVDLASCAVLGIEP